MKPKLATSTSQIDNDDVRVTEWRLPPGSATGHHRHAYDYVIVPMTGGALTAIVDANKFQLDGPVDAINSLAPLDAKFAAFGWRVIEVDGHDVAAVVDALQQARAGTDAPTCIIAHTVKGKGVSFMEHNNEFHGKAPTAEQLAAALEPLS